MNILFVSLGDFDNLQEGSVHIDLLKQLSEEHSVYLLCKRERRQKKPTELTRECNINVLRVKTGNIKNTNLIEKGISMIMLERQFLRAVKKHLKSVKFDLILYATPPITIVKTVKFVKKRDNAKTYLLLKDIFPQNAVDLGMMKKSGLKGVLFKYFRNKEKKLYEISDYIGCMSQANVDYTLKMNPEISSDKVGICPNSIKYVDMSVSDDERCALRTKYGIPLDKKVFVYGGNLGRPQGIPFIIDCLKAVADNDGAFFLIVGGGTEYSKLEEFVNTEKPKNVKLMRSLPKSDYDKMVAACDVGMIFLDHRFTIPNFPSRLLAYMQAAIPVIACTDPNTDIGDVITEGDFGWWCESNSAEDFTRIVNSALSADLPAMGQRGVKYLIDNYTVEKSCELIKRQF